MNLSTIMFIQSAMYNNMYTYKTMYRYNCFGRGGCRLIRNLDKHQKKKIIVIVMFYFAKYVGYNPLPQSGSDSYEVHCCKSYLSKCTGTGHKVHT